MNNAAKILLGLIILIGTIVVSWFSSVYDWTIFGKSLDFLHAGWILLKGGIFWFLLFIGLITIFLGISDLKD